MKKTTSKRGITIPSKKILGFTGDGSEFAEKIKEDYFAFYERPIEDGIPIIETRIQFYRNHKGDLCYRQIFRCPKCGELHYHTMNKDNHRMGWRASHCPNFSEYILYINSRGFVGLCSRGFWPKTSVEIA